MAETIPGGAFLLADKKTWVNAKGERIAAPKEEVYKRPEEELPLTEEILTPGDKDLRARLAVRGSQDEYETPEGVELEKQPKPRRPRGSSS